MLHAAPESHRLRFQIDLDLSYVPFAPLYRVDKVDVALEMKQWTKRAEQASTAHFSISGTTSTLFTLYDLKGF